MLANEMWWTGEQAGLFGGFAGSMCGVLGASIGVIVPLLANKGKGRNLVYGMFVGMAALGVLALSIGCFALIKDQPYHVWYPGLLFGFLLTVLACSIFPVVVLRYRQAEHRLMDADLLRGGQPRKKQQTSITGIICFALITVMLTSGSTYGLVLVFKTITSASPSMVSKSRASDSHNFVLDNGIQVHLLPFENIGWVGVIASYDVGFIDDPKGYPQLAHLVEHLRVTGATSDSDANERLTLLNEIGSANAETQPHFTYYDYLVPKDQLELILQTETDRLSNLQLTQEDILREGPRAAEEAVGIASSNPAYLHKFALMAAIQAWRWGETHANIITGLDAIPIEFVEEFITEHYRPDSLKLYVAGDFDITSIHALLGETLGSVQGPNKAKNIRVEDWSGVTRLDIMTWDLPATIVAASLKPPQTDQDRRIVTTTFAANLTQIQNDTSDTLMQPLGTSMQWPSGVLPTFMLGTVKEISSPQEAVSNLAQIIMTPPPSQVISMSRKSIQMQLPELTPEFIASQAKQLASMRGINESKAKGMIVLQSALNRAVWEMVESPVVRVSNDSWNAVLAASLNPQNAGSLIIHPQSD